ncbi:MAG: type II toxin-antitoxin system PemK/MazF family toxin [Treponema sp.]|nr:type II toxin-antitoxin system PemK/MazF family toxin [Treponema sp.]
MVKGEIWWANLPSARGSEPAKRRPVLIIQGDEFNSSKISTVICAIITSNLQLSKSPPNILIEKAHSCLQKSSVINFSQILTVDKSFFIEMVSMLPKQFLQQIDKALISIFDIKNFK